MGGIRVRACTDGVGAARRGLQKDARAAAAACGGVVTRPYARAAIADNAVLFVAYDGARPVGFLSARPEGPRGMALDVLCAERGGGAPLIHSFVAWCDSVGRGDVSLGAMATVLGFYPRFDFAARASCTSPPLQVPPSLRDARFASVDDAYADPTVGAFLEQLQSRGLNVSKDGGCASRRLTLGEIVDRDCGNDGYRMMRCAAEGRPSPGPSARGRKLRRSERLRALGARQRRAF